MLLKKVEAIIEKGPMTSIAVEVFAHVVPVLKAVHGEMNVTVTDTVLEPEECDVENEHINLVKTYGVDSESGQPFVDAAYGAVFSGNLDRAIRECEHIDVSDEEDRTSDNTDTNAGDQLSTEEYLSTEEPEKPKRGRRTGK